MAVPTITAIAPSSGPSRGGFLVVIDGSNFRDVPAVPSSGYVGGTFPRTVRVQFGGVDAEDVRVLDSGKLTCVVPAYSGHSTEDPISAHDVRIANLDPVTGDEVPGESVTAASAFSYQRPQLDGDNDLRRVVREVLRVLKRQVHPNVSMVTHTDFDDDVADLLNTVAMTELPGILVTGPQLRTNRFYSINDRAREVQPTSRESRYRQTPRTVDLVFGIVGVAAKTTHLLALQDECTRFFERNQWIGLDRDPSDPGSGRVRWEFVLTEDPTVATRPNESNVQHFTGSFEIRGFDIELGEVASSFDVDSGDGEVVNQIESI